MIYFKSGVTREYVKDTVAPWLVSKGYKLSMSLLNDNDFCIRIQSGEITGIIFSAPPDEKLLAEFTLKFL